MDLTIFIYRIENYLCVQNNLSYVKLIVFSIQTLKFSTFPYEIVY